MKIQHLGKLVEGLDEDQTALENRIVLSLLRHGKVRQSILFPMICGGRIGRDTFDAAITRLLTEEILVCVSTTRKGSFLLTLTEWGKQQAEELQFFTSQTKGIDKDRADRHFKKELREKEGQ